MLVRALAVAAAGAGLMYLLDPDGGRRRRAVMRDQLVSAAHRTGHAVDSTSRDVGNRARGVVAELRGRLATQPVDDDVLRERVRARLGTVVGHAGAIDVGAADGVVTLRGPILADEVDRLIRRVRGVRGVRDIVDQLDVHDEPAGVPGLQGRPRRGEVRELLQTRWSPGAPLVAALVGVAMAMLGAWRRRRAGR